MLLSGPSRLLRSEKVPYGRSEHASMTAVARGTCPNYNNIYLSGLFSSNGRFSAILVMEFPWCFGRISYSENINILLDFYSSIEFFKGFKEKCARFYDDKLILYRVYIYCNKGLVPIISEIPWNRGKSIDKMTCVFHAYTTTIYINR